MKILVFTFKPPPVRQRTSPSLIKEGEKGGGEIAEILALTN